MHLNVASVSNVFLHVHRLELLTLLLCCSKDRSCSDVLSQQAL